MPKPHVSSLKMHEANQVRVRFGVLCVFSSYSTLNWLFWLKDKFLFFFLFLLFLFLFIYLLVSNHLNNKNTSKAYALSTSTSNVHWKPMLDTLRLQRYTPSKSWALLWMLHPKVRFEACLTNSFENTAWIDNNE